ncbi:DUF4178 domain-containing protein [Solitalea sp. MAHUQ-68]|uniref:DUF4178 domain-containing protein n=1 Tax=Solitalea agri TaxID=2953739 RepID=A0A9X2JB73_9SPHI|nr:DUF4178 domain-containing protein [Solitalea agri]MCO4292192.1 DUF4178 domain-containing protein [Solitalea agri]
MGSLLRHNYLGSSGTVNCPECSSTIKVLDYQNSICFGCPICHTFFKTERTSQKLRTFKLTNDSPVPAIPIGTKGEINGYTFVVAAFMIKKESGNEYRWREYLLINQEKGYAFLSEYDGHWNFIVGKNFLVDLKPKGNMYQARYNGLPFKLFNKYTPQVIYASGEFDWNILEEKIACREFISPPFMLVHEKQDSISDWYMATYKSSDEIAEAFSLKNKLLPAKIGIGANEVSSMEKQQNGVIKITLIAILFLFLYHVFSAYSNESAVIFDQRFTPERDSSSWGSTNFKTITTSSFKVNGPTMLDVYLNSEVDNNWLEVPVTLVEEKTGKFYEFTKAIEYYHGYEDGESWSEGSKSTDATLSRIPTGTYHLTIEPSSDILFPNSIRVTVNKSNSIWSNFFLASLLLIAIPVLQFFRINHFDKKRWMNSDYSPYRIE